MAQSLAKFVAARTGAEDGAFVLAFVLQLVALPATEERSTVDDPATSATGRAHEPLTIAAEVGVGPRIGYEIANTAPVVLTGPRLVDQQDAVALDCKSDPGNLLFVAAPAEGSGLPRFEHLSAVHPCDVDAEVVFALVDE